MLEETKFYKDRPFDINEKALVMLVNSAYDECRDNKEISYVKSKFSNYEKNPSESEWFAFFSELVFRKWLKEILGVDTRVIFAQKRDNDLKVIHDAEEYKVEVKTILDSDYSRIKRKAIHRIVNVPTGKSFSFKSRFPLSRNLSKDEKLKRLENYYNEALEYVVSNRATSNWKIKEIGTIKDRKRTGIIGFVDGYIVDELYISQTIKNHLMKKEIIRGQVNKADIICFYIYNSKIDSKAILRVINELPKTFEDKVFGFFTVWQGGKPRFVSKSVFSSKLLNKLFLRYVG